MNDERGGPVVDPTNLYERRVKRVFLDMDGVLADFERLRRETETLARAEQDADGPPVQLLRRARPGYFTHLTGDMLKHIPGAFASMQPIPGAIAGVKVLIGKGFDVWVASKPATGLPHTYSEKAGWILRWFPELKRKIILTHDKGLLGCAEDYLVDDRVHKANCAAFRGRLLHFGFEAGALDWGDLGDFFRSQDPEYLVWKGKVT